jgi:hypothetical protein
VRQSHERGLPLRIGELNSLSCFGQPGVSDTLASAVWMADALFEYANVGVDGVNVMSHNGGAYDLFTFATDDASYRLTSIGPDYYGVLLFQQAAPAGARMLPVYLRSSANLKVWATLDASGTRRVLAINKEATQPISLNIALPGGGPASLLRLLGPALDAKRGVTLGGQTFDGSTDGTLQGLPSLEALLPSAADASYTVTLDPVSAALLVIPAG